MLSENIQSLSLLDLLDLLVITTAQMHHNLVWQKETDIFVIRDTRKDVQLIQSAILKKKSVNWVSVIIDRAPFYGKILGRYTPKKKQDKKKKDWGYSLIVGR